MGYNLRRHNMLTTALAASLTLQACGGRASIDPPPTARVVEYQGGKWFDGKAFAPRTMYVVGDVFRERRPSRVDSVVDLRGGYVVPPFADAHQHLYDPSRVKTFIAAFLRD